MQWGSARRDLGASCYRSHWVSSEQASTIREVLECAVPCRFRFGSGCPTPPNLRNLRTSR